MIYSDIPSLPEVLGVSRISIAAPGHLQMLYNLSDFGDFVSRASARLCNGQTSRNKCISRVLIASPGGGGGTPTGNESLQVGMSVYFCLLIFQPHPYVSLPGFSLLFFPRCSRWPVTVGLCPWWWIFKSSNFKLSCCQGMLQHPQHP